MNLWETLTKEHGLNEAWLKKKTENYWDVAEKNKKNGRDEQERWQRYLQDTATSAGSVQAVTEQNCSLFECEMAYAANAGRLPEPEEDKAITLVILVGESFEPLLQSVWAHNPVRLVPVVNEAYPDGSNGNVQWNAIRVPLEMLLKRKPSHGEWQLTIPTVKFDAPEDQRDCFAPVVDEPTAVFKFLQKHLKADLSDPSRRVIVDITGAKKTMVAGAFMLAAYSDTEICYVDSKEHHDGRPYGYACHFRKVDNPLKELALQSWHNIEKLYSKGDYAHALAILNAAYPQEKEAEGQEKQEYFQEIRDFRTYLQICAHWDEGNIQEAAELIPELIKKSKKLRKCVPFAVRTLAKEFPKTDEPTLNLELFSKPKKIVIYAYDEIERVKRLIQKDASRAAFSRAYALHEALLNFRVTMLFTKHALTMKSKKRVDYYEGLSNNENVEWNTKAQIACTNMLSSGALNVLQGSDYPQTIFWFTPKPNPRPNENPKIKHEVTIKWENPVTHKLKYVSGGIRPDDELKNRRNLITHSYFPAKKEYAEEALRQAERNFAEYKKNWVNFPDEVDIIGLDDPELYSVPPWETIRDKFGLQFIPVEKV